MKRLRIRVGGKKLELTFDDFPLGENLGKVRTSVQQFRNQFYFDFAPQAQVAETRTILDQPRPLVGRDVGNSHQRGAKVGVDSAPELPSIGLRFPEDLNARFLAGIEDGEERLAREPFLGGKASLAIRSQVEQPLGIEVPQQVDTFDSLRLELRKIDLK